VDDRHETALMRERPAGLNDAKRALSTHPKPPYADTNA
jgi:hypothetical protein